MEDSTASTELRTHVTSPRPSSESFSNDDWATVEAHPDSYKGATVNLVGKVFQIRTADDGTPAIQIWADPKNNAQNTVVYVPSTSGINDQDFVRVRGTVYGTFEGENAFGAKLRLPVVDAESVAKVSGLELASPAVATVRGKPSRIAGLTIHPWKVEWAQDETRVFLKVENRSGYDFSVYGHSARLVIDGEQFNATFTSADYPEISSDLLDGARTSGVIVFPPTDPEATSTKLTIEGYSDNSDLGRYGSISTSWGWTR
jgi:hypothetical protein